MCDDSPNSTCLTILTISWENTKIPPKLIFGSHYEKGFSFHKKVLFLTVWYRTRFIGSTVCVHYLRDQKQPDCNYDFVLKIAIFVKFSMYRPLFFVSKILYVRTFLCICLCCSLQISKLQTIPIQELLVLIIKQLQVKNILGRKSTKPEILNRQNRCNIKSGNRENWQHPYS